MTREFFERTICIHCGAFQMDADTEPCRRDKPAIETGWVIKSDLGPVYYGKTKVGLGCTTESLDAIRFARKCDAEAVISENGWNAAKAVEHQWG